jgi:hypothetical protein
MTANDKIKTLGRKLIVALTPSIAAQDHWMNFAQGWAVVKVHNPGGGCPLSSLP